MRRFLISVSIFSMLINILGLTGSFFMLQVYDRVLPSGSIPTLVALALLTMILFSLYGFLDAMRGRVLSRAGALFERSLSSRVFAVITGFPLRYSGGGDVLKPARELDQIRTFLSGPGLAMLFDLPWLPFYLAICFFLHPFIGILASGTIVVLGVLNLLAGVQTRKLTGALTEATVDRNRYGEAASRNAEALAAMGMNDRAAQLWDKAGGDVIILSSRAADVSGFYSGLPKTIRNIVQSGALGLGAYLVVQGDLSGGAIIAGSIIVARTLAPVELMITHWRSMLSAHQGWKRLKRLIADFPEEAARTSLPAPEKHLAVEGVSIAAPGQRKPVVSNASFRADAGTVVGVVGPSASGKSTLVRGVTGVWPLLHGRVSLDGASLDQWSASARGKHIGYMPQSSEFFPGSIARNIARLDPDAEHADIVAAAQAAGAHEMIVRLADGYETVTDENGTGLSAGQRQRIALARALYGEPFLVVLDEPNSNLDGEGEVALSQAIAGVRSRGGIVVVVAHRNSVMSEVDLLLVMEGGQAKAFGPRDAVLRAVQQQQQRMASKRGAGPALAVIENEDKPS